MNNSDNNNNFLQTIISGIIVTVIGGLLLGWFQGWFSQDPAPSFNDSESSQSNTLMEEVVDSSEPEVEAIVVVDTPAPTVDPNPALQLPFSDNFDAGLRPEWRIVGSSPIFVDGKLIGGDGSTATIEIGNSTLKDYSIQFNISTTRENSFRWGGYNSNLELFLHPDLKVEFWSADLAGRITWFRLENSEWKRIHRDEFVADDLSNNFIIDVSGNSFVVTMDGEQVGNLVYQSSYATGSKLLLRVKGIGVAVDNFSMNPK